uniref:Baculoviral IAP repeat containing 5b n=1 Tax=Hucho hucho TaxID=62062 RepID=A0A4W5QKV5_9TELE
MVIYYYFFFNFQLILNFCGVSDYHSPNVRLKSFPNYIGGRIFSLLHMAGFAHCPSENEPDVACCFFCLREQECWEPEDNPWSEHIKRSPNCGFLAIRKDFGELTVAEFYHLEQERLHIYIISSEKRSVKRSGVIVPQTSQ